MLSEVQLRDQLAQFVSNQISRDEFEDWFVQNSWNVHKNHDLAAQRLAYAVELRLAENSSGHLPDEDMRKELIDFLHSPFRIGGNPDDPIVSSGSGNSLISQPLEVVTVDTQLVMAS